MPNNKDIHVLTNIALETTPLASEHLVTKGYVDSRVPIPGARSLCRYSTTGAIVLTDETVAYQVFAKANTEISIDQSHLMNNFNYSVGFRLLLTNDQTEYGFSFPNNWYWLGETPSLTGTNTTHIIDVWSSNMGNKWIAEYKGSVPFNDSYEFYHDGLLLTALQVNGSTISLVDDTSLYIADLTESNYASFTIDSSRLSAQSAVCQFYLDVLIGDTTPDMEFPNVHSWLDFDYIDPRENNCTAMYQFFSLDYGQTWVGAYLGNVKSQQGGN